MKSFFNSPSFRFPFFAKRPSALERAVRQSPKSRRLRMEPLENRALLAVDAFGGVASLAESNVEETWGPDPAPAALSASVLATVAEIVDVSGVNATLDATSFSVQAETPKPVAPPSFDQLMESLGMIEIESLGDENDVASLSFLDDATDEAAATSDAVVRRVVFYDSSANDFDASFLNVCEPNLYYIDTAANVAEATGVSSRSGGSGGDDETSFEITVNGSTQLSEYDGFPSGGGIAESFISVDVPILGSYSRVLRVTPSTGSGAILNQDYIVVANRPDVEGPAEPYAIGGGDYFDVSGGTTFYVVPLNDTVIEDTENFSLGLSVVEYGSGGGTVAQLEPITASIVDGTPAVSVYWDTEAANNPQHATVSDDPNGGLRVYPERNSYSELLPSCLVTLRFKLDKAPKTTHTVYYKLCDPDNFISLGKQQGVDDNYTPNDNYQTLPLKQRQDTEFEFSDFQLNQTFAITFQPNQTERTVICCFQQSYAGDNFIVVAGNDQGIVANAQLGTTADTRYQVVQPTNAPDKAKPVQTQKLTVWRTLWTELDTLKYNSETADPPLIDGIVATELARACVTIKEFSNNTTPEIVVENKECSVTSLSARAVDLLPTAVNSWFWGTRLIGAFSTNSEEQFGEYHNGTIGVYNDTIEDQVAIWNNLYPSEPELNIELFKQRTALHEIGHVLSLGHTGSGIMLAKNDNQGLTVTVGGVLEPENLVFSKNQLAAIQSLEMPQKWTPSSAND